jgi:hypothetical protein
MTPDEERAAEPAAEPTMTRAEAVAALAAGYQVRVMLEVRHGDRGAHLMGSTFTHDRAELAAAVPGLLGIMLPRVVRLVEDPDA